jgi:hypothetical protein
MVKKREIFSYQYMKMHTPIESPGRDDKNHAVFKIIYGAIRPKKAKNRVKMLKNRLFEVERKSKKKVKTQMRPNFFRDYILSHYLNMKIKIWIFFHRAQWTHQTMVPKTTLKELLSYIQIK